MQKFAVVLLACLCMASGAMATDVPDRFIDWLTRFFEISRSEAEKCVTKTGLTSGKIKYEKGLGVDLLLRLLKNSEENSWHLKFPRKRMNISENLQEFTRGLGSDYVSEDTRKVACVFSCAAEINGVLINGKVQVKKLHDLVTQAGNTAPEDVLQKAHEIVDSCLKEIDETNECDLVHKLLNCVVKEYER